MPSGKFRVAAWSWGEGPTVLLAHGWNGNPGQLASFIQPLVDAGFRVVAFDQPAHGRSSGRQATLLDMSEATLAVARAVGPVHAVVAHSLGASATVLALFDHLPASRVVLFAPPCNVPYFARRLASMLGLSADREAGTLEQIERRVGVHLKSLDLRLIAGWVRQPALLFHDLGDQDVPFADGQALADAWPQARFVPLERLGHVRPLTDPGVVRATVDFLREGRVPVSLPVRVATSG